MLAASLVSTLVSLLSPDGERGGVAKHTRLLTSLFLVCVMIAPLRGAISALQNWQSGDLTLPWLENVEENDYQEDMQEALDTASRDYFTKMLTQTLEQKFLMDVGDVRCAVHWSDGGSSPEKVTVILSGSAIWKNPKEIQSFVTSLLSCECAVAIE